MWHHFSHLDPRTLQVPFDWVFTLSFFWGGVKTEISGCFFTFMHHERVTLWLCRSLTWRFSFSPRCFDLLQRAQSDPLLHYSSVILFLVAQVFCEAGHWQMWLSVISLTWIFWTRAAGTKTQSHRRVTRPTWRAERRSVRFSYRFNIWTSTASSCASTSRPAAFIF